MLKVTKKTTAKKAAVKKTAAKKGPKKAVAQSATKKVAKPKAGGRVASAAFVAKPLDTPPKDFRVRIRMYRHGLGDCFVLSFPGRNKQLVHLMIDCGVVLGTSKPASVMTMVARDIQETTGGKVDVLAITHEHWDHLSGFDASQAQADFDQIEFENLWLAWTEDDTNDLANALRDERERKKAAARAIKKKAAKLKLTEQVERLNGLLGFFGAAADNSGDGDDEGEEGGGTAGALNYLKGRCKATIIPTGGKPLVIPGVENVRVYVLGPPANRADLNKTNPGKGQGYELMSGGSLGLAQALIDACDGEEKSQPFEPRFRRKLSKMSAKHSYRLPQNTWRNIDYDWLAVGERLALQLDSATNNTSLVLAFEFIDSGDVMLFVGDAQAGNWRSWGALSFEVKDADGVKQTVTAADLLARTIFYKVGHHGSHNATLKEKGLERMTSNRLAAVIPVDVNVAHDVKGWKRMPLPSLTKTLMNKCTVLFQSDDVAKVRDGAAPPRFMISAKTFDVFRKDKATKKIEVARKNENLYYDYFP
jgi:Metallo-beta-lactamase superfamily